MKKKRLIMESQIHQGTKKILLYSSLLILFILLVIAVPSLVTVRLSSDTNKSVSNLFGFCNISDSNSIYYEWFKNGVSNLTGSLENATLVSIAGRVLPSSTYVYLALSNDAAYTLGGDSVVSVNTTTLSVLNQFTNSSCLNTTSSIFTVNNLAYITATNGNSLGIINKSNASSLSQIGCFTNNSALQGASNVYVINDLAYVTGASNASLTILNISDPSSIIQLNSFSNISSMNQTIQVIISDNEIYAYLISSSQGAPSSDGLTILNVSNISSITQISTFNNGSVLNDTRYSSIVGDYIYASSYLNSSVTIINITDRYSPKQVGSFSNNNSVSGMKGATASITSTDGKLIYVLADGSHSISLLNASNKSNILNLTYIQDSELISNPQFGVVSGGKIYTAISSLFLKINTTKTLAGTPAQEFHVSTLSNSSLRSGDSWIISCTASNGTTNSTTINSTAIFITDSNTTFTTNITNNTAPKINEATQFNITITDDDLLSGFIFSYDNGTGSLANDSFRTLSSTSAAVSINKTTQRAYNTNITWKYYVNDSVGTWVSSNNYTLTVVNTLPTILSASINNTLPDTSSDLECLNGTTSDADSQTITLNYAWFKNDANQNLNSRNLSNTFTSDLDRWKCSITPFDSVNNGSTLTSSEVTINSTNVAPSINWTNATTSNTGVNSTLANPTNNNSYILINVQWNDNNTQDSHTLFVCKSDSANSTGCTGQTFCNSSANITNNPLQCNITLSSSGLSNKTYSYFAYVIDNSSVLASSVSNTFAVNHPPTTPSLIFPLNNTFRNVTWHNLTVSSNDSDSDTQINYTFYADTSADPITVVYNASNNYTNFTNLNDTSYYWKVLATDDHGYASIQNSSIFNFTVDATLPSIVVTAPSNVSTTTSKTISFNYSSTDVRLDTCWFNLTKAASGDLEGAAFRSLTCNQNTTFAVDLFTDYIINLFSNDTAANINVTRIHFTTSSTSAGSSSSAGGGGGGGDEDLPPQSVVPLSICGNQKCEEDESPAKCSVDCKVNIDTLLSGETLQQAWFARGLIYSFLGLTLFVFIRRQIEIK